MEKSRLPPEKKGWRSKGVKERIFFEKRPKI